MTAVSEIQTNKILQIKRYELSRSIQLNAQDSSMETVQVCLNNTAQFQNVYFWMCGALHLTTYLFVLQGVVPTLKNTSWSIPNNVKGATGARVKRVHYNVSQIQTKFLKIYATARQAEYEALRSL